MLQSFLGVLRGIIALFLLTFATFGIALFIFLAVLLRFLPIKTFQNKIDAVLHNVPEHWTYAIKKITSFLVKTRWHIYGIKNLKKDGHYLMIANHRSWLDIVVLQRVFSRKIPGLRFFMKRELLWQLPLLGYACKLLGYPFMQRYSKEFLLKHPELKGKDIEATRKACERFKDQPVTMISFIEGGRFNQEIHDKQKSPFKYLLKPKAGGIAFILAILGKQIESLIDVTIIYPDMQITLWDFLCGKISDIYVYIHLIPVKQELLGDYQNDADFRHFFYYWLNEQWFEKDKFIINKFRSHFAISTDKDTNAS